MKPLSTFFRMVELLLAFFVLSPALALAQDASNDDPQSWTVQIHGGFARIHYFPADVNVNATGLKVVLKHFQFQERTSANAYDPTTWTGLENAFQWIDEPTNAFDVDLKNGKNVIFIGIIHPKYTTGMIDPNAITPQGGNGGTAKILNFQETYQNVNAQVGYGREIILFHHDRAGKLTYTPSVRVGVTTGATYYEAVDATGQQLSKQEPFEVQGMNFSLANRLDYQKGRVILYIDQTFTTAHVKTQLMDGTIEYQLNTIPVTFGIGVALGKHPG